MSDSIFGDFRYAVRTLLKRPGFSLLVIVTLGLGIGANTAIFSAVDGLLLRDPPFRQPEHLVRITSVRGDEDGGASDDEEERHEPRAEVRVNNSHSKRSKCLSTAGLDISRS